MFIVDPHLLENGIVKDVGCAPIVQKDVSGIEVSY